MLVISLILFILVIVAAFLKEMKPQHADIATKIMAILVVLALINFVVTVMGVL